MGELAARAQRGAEPNDEPSRYARMIPGISVAQNSQQAAAAQAEHGAWVDSGRRVRSPRPKSMARALLPHPSAEPFPLYRAVVTDLILLSATGSVQRLLVPRWSLAWFGLPIFAVMVTLFAFSEGIYRNTCGPLSREILCAWMRSVLFATMLVFLAQPGAMPLGALPATVGGSLAGVVLYRHMQYWSWRRNGKGDEFRKVLIVGGGKEAKAIARTLGSDPAHRALVCGSVADDLPRSASVLGRIADLDWLARAEFIDEVILALPGCHGQAVEAAEVALRNHLDILAVPDLPAGPWPEAGVDFIGEVPVVTLHREPVPSASLFLKRLLDITGAAVCLVLAAPVMLILALLIRLDSPGPITYSAERIGVKGRRFRCYKFRSMVVDADQVKDELRARNQRQGPTFKIVDDPRITRTGKFIRRYSLDELPQLWNVLRGEMSLVGPRPHPVDDVNRYELHHYRRLDMKPGITGLWQITARRSPSF